MKQTFCLFFYLALAHSIMCASADTNADGRCLPFAISYCQSHPGSHLILVTWPLRGGKLSCHAFVENRGAIVDNKHPDRHTVFGNDPVRWLGAIGYSLEGAKLFRVIDFDSQSAEDKHVIEVLKRTVQ